MKRFVVPLLLSICLLVIGCKGKMKITRYKDVMYGMNVNTGLFYVADYDKQSFAILKEWKDIDVNCYTTKRGQYTSWYNDFYVYESDITTYRLAIYD